MGAGMVMSFFRRTDEQGKTGTALSSSPEDRGFGAASLRLSPSQPKRDLGECQAFGAVIEENQLSSEELLSGIGFVQERVSSLLGAHGEALSELGNLRTEQARIVSLLEYESNARRKLDAEASRSAAECKELKADNAQLRLETEETREKLIKLQALHEVNAQELQIIQSRLRDTGRELEERIAQYDETAALLKRAHQDLDLRNREFAEMREKYETERTSHHVLSETSKRESDAQAREIARLNEERVQLKNSLEHHETMARNLLNEVTALRQELSFAEEKVKRLQSEIDNQQSATAIEMSRLATKHEAINSKAELVEKLLVTARSRSKMAEDELQAVRGELKQAKAELTTADLRAERLAQELAAARAGNSENEAARRELSLQVSELTMRMRDLENLRSKRERDNETMRRDLDQRAHADSEEIRQLRSSAEVTKAEIRQLKSEIAILTGQLEVARNDRNAPAPAANAARDSLETRQLTAGAPGPKPIIEISEKSLRSPPVADI